MATRVRFPPDDIAEWISVPVSVAYSSDYRSDDIEEWIANEISGKYYMRDNYQYSLGGGKLFRVYFFSNSDDGMWFAMRWS